MSYGGDPTNSTTDAIRLLIGDTDNTDLIFTNAELTYLYNQSGSNVTLAAYKAALSAASKFGRDNNKSVGDLRIDRKRHEQYIQLSKELYEQVIKLGLNAVTPYAGGISRSDKEAVEEDTDRVRPNFKRGQFDNPDYGTDDDPIVYYREG